SFFYQEEPFLSGRDIYYVDTRKYSANVCRFIATCLQTIVFKYPYNFGLFPELLKDERIMLPVDSKGELNWMYMEEYMQKVMEEVESSIENLSQTDNRKHEVNISEWKEFVIGDLFDIHPTKSYKKINIELFEEDGTNPVVVNTGFNNGIGGYANLECTEKAGTITFTDTAAKSTDSFFYQERDFIGYPHVQGMYAKTHEWTKNEGLFLNSVIKSLLKGQYDF
ncbi:restriction enzyme BgcI subunit beta, partial [human gut metagenome]